MEFISWLSKAYIIMKQLVTLFVNLFLGADNVVIIQSIGDKLQKAYVFMLKKRYELKV